MSIGVRVSKLEDVGYCREANAQGQCHLGRGREFDPENGMGYSWDSGGAIIVSFMNEEVR